MSLQSEKQNELFGKIISRKNELGLTCLILTHHYQRPEVVAIGDIRGDSLGLSRHAAGSSARYIVFCGVRFMAESAVILAAKGQSVYHPEPTSGCPMSDMADQEDVERAFAELDGLLGEGAYLPVTYVNSSAEVKASTGRRGGACCTSTNAAAVMKWALGTGKKVIFIPDEYLGLNTAAKLGVEPGRIIHWDFSLPLGGNEPVAVKSCRLIVWQGYCHVHTYFTPEHVKLARERFPGAKVIVHPECNPAVVNAADASGSTEFMVRFVKESKPGSITVVGTELNLVRRLATEYPDRTVVELARSFCPNMFKITLTKVLHTLENLDSAEQRVVVPEKTKSEAVLALKRMLEIS